VHVAAVGVDGVVEDQVVIAANRPGGAPAGTLAQWAAGMLAAALLMGAANSGSATTGPDLQARSARQECTGEVPACLTVRGGVERIRPDSEREIELVCPAKARYFWIWAAEPGRHVQVQLLGLIRNKDKAEIGARFALSEQSGADPGFARVFLGCSAQRAARGKLEMRYEGFGWHPHQ
jgi:hypothetical protein